MIPTHSIIIPTKDRPRLLRRAVLSALASTAADGEVLVVDDNSKVSARSILADVAQPGLRIIDLAPGQTGVSVARNAGIEAAGGAVIFFLDDDDELMAEYCGRVLSRAVAGHDYGFSAYLLAPPPPPLWRG